METETSLEISPETTVPSYTWEQDFEYAYIQVPIDNSVVRKDISCIFKRDYISIKVRGQVICEGKLSGTLYPDECAWIFDTTRDRRFLTVNLTKTNAQNFDGWWYRLFDNDQEYRPRPERKITELTSDARMPYEKMFHERK